MWKLLIYLTLAIIVILEGTCRKITEKDLGERLLGLSKHLHTKCSGISSCSEKCVNKMKNGIFDTTNIHAKRYTECLYKESGIMSEHLHVNRVLLERMLPPKIAKSEVAIYLKCVEVGKKSGEKRFMDKAFLITKCIHDSSPDTYFMF